MYKPTSKEKEVARDAYNANFRSEDYQGGKVIKTTKDKQFEQTIQLREDADHLEHTIELLKQSMKTLMDPSVGSTSKKATQTFANKVLLPALEHMLSHIREVAVTLAPIASTKYAYDRELATKKRKARAVESDSNEAIEVSLLRDYVNRNNVKKKQQGTTTTPSKMSTRSSAKKTPPNTTPVSIVVTPPAPKDGKAYKKSEFCEVMSNFLERGQQRTAMLNAIIEKKYVVTNSKTTLNRYLAEYQRFVPGETFKNDEMRGVGRPAIIDDVEFKETMDKFKDHNGQVMTHDSVKELLEDTKRRKLEDAGYYAVGEHVSVSDQTASNYVAMCAGHEGIHLANSAISKTEARQSAEGSIRNVCNNIILILQTHFVEVPEEDLNIRKMAKDLPDKDRIMYDLASKVRGNRAVIPVPAKNKVNRDDKVVWVKAGSEDGIPQLTLLCSQTSLRKRGHSSLSRVTDESNVSGIRTKIHADLNGEGASAKQCLTFALNEREMPHDDIIVLELEGLCIGGPASNNTGYVIFLKKTPGAELKRFQFIEENIHLPFIEERCRSKDFPDCPVVSSCDGDMSQLKCVTGKSMIDAYNEKNITAIKHNASNTGCEQSCDKGKVFPTIESEINKLTVADLPGSNDTMKKRLDEFYHDNKTRILLTGQRKIAITNTICCFPGIATKAFTQKNARNGFISNANLDEKYKLFPSFDGILGTCKRLITTEVLELFMNNIQLLFDTMEKLGHIPEEVFDKIGIPEDERSNGDVFKRDAGIERECQQRAKILNHSHQIKLRDKRREEIDAAKREKELAARNKILEKIDGDKATVQKLLDRLKGRDNSAEQSLANCTVDDFFSLKVDWLRPFILHRTEDKKYNTVTKLRPITKGTREQAQTEAQAEGSKDDHLVSIAFRLRNNECKLVDLPEEEESSTSSTTTNRATIIRVAMDPTTNLKSPAEILSNSVWLDNISRILNSRETQSLLPIDDEAKTRATSLSRVLFQRLEIHVNKRVKVESKRNHPILRWFRNNIPIFASCMVRQNHVKRNPSSLNINDCLLTTSVNNFLLINSNNRDLEGAYLVYDSSEEKFVRSGKCTGRGMEKRWEEHLKNAKADTNPSDSKFVGTYPSKESTRASRSNGRCFENLQQYAAAGFEPVVSSFELFQKDYDCGGLFQWTAAERELVCGTKVPGAGDNDLLKFASVAGYGFELCYDLAISPRDNVSESPGFEAFGLMFGG